MNQKGIHLNPKTIEVEIDIIDLRGMESPVGDVITSSPNPLELDVNSGWLAYPFKGRVGFVSKLLLFSCCSSLLPLLTAYWHLQVHQHEHIGGNMESKLTEQAIAQLDEAYTKVMNEYATKRRFLSALRGFMLCEGGG